MPKHNRGEGSQRRLTETEVSNIYNKLTKIGADKFLKDFQDETDAIDRIKKLLDIFELSEKEHYTNIEVHPKPGYGYILTLTSYESLRIVDNNIRQVRIPQSFIRLNSSSREYRNAHIGTSSGQSFFSASARPAPVNRRNKRKSVHVYSEGSRHHRFDSHGSFFNLKQARQPVHSSNRKFRPRGPKFQPVEYLLTFEGRNLLYRLFEDQLKTAEQKELFHNLKSFSIFRDEGRDEKIHFVLKQLRIKIDFRNPPYNVSRGYVITFYNAGERQTFISFLGRTPLINSTGRKNFSQEEKMDFQTSSDHRPAMMTQSQDHLSRDEEATLADKFGRLSVGNRFGA